MNIGKSTKQTACSQKNRKLVRRYRKLKDYEIWLTISIIIGLAIFFIGLIFGMILTSKSITEFTTDPIVIAKYNLIGKQILVFIIHFYMRFFIVAAIIVTAIYKITLMFMQIKVDKLESEQRKNSSLNIIDKNK